MLTLLRLIFIIQIMNKITYFLFLIYLLFAFNSVSFSQFEEQEIDPVYQMEDFVVTASRFGQALSELSPSVSVFSNKTIEKGLYLNVRDVLNQIPGVYLAANGGMGKVTSMFTRGSESNHTAILLNGRRLPTGFSGLYDLGQLSLTNVGSIEVVRGDNSSLYGGAIGGVVNIRSNLARGELSQKFKLELGSDNAKFLNYNYGISNDRVNASFSINSANTDGYQENSAFDRDSANLYFIYALNESVDLDFQYFNYSTSLGVRGSLFDYKGDLQPPSNEVNKTKAYMYSPGVSINTSDSSNFKLIANFSKNELTAVETNTYDEYDSNYNPTGRVLNSDKLFVEDIECLEATYDFKYNENMKSIVGVLYEKRKYQESPIDLFGTSGVSNFEVSYDTKSLFTNSIYRIDSLSELEFGGRVDSFSNNFDTSKSGSIKYSKSLNNEANTRIHAKYSYGKNPPDLLILAYGDSYNFFLSDADIQLETIRSNEIGFKTDIGGHELGFVYFYNFINNLSTAPYSFLLNGYERVLVDSSQRGSESYLSGKLADNIQYSISYSYLDAKDDEGNQLVRRPKHKLMISFFRAFTDFNIGLNVTKVSGLLDSGDVALEDYSVARIFGTYTVNDSCSFHFRLENAFDKEYDYLNGYPAPPKQGYLGLTYNF